MVFDDRIGARRLRLAAEFAALFIGLPVLMVFAFSPDMVWGVVAAMTLGGGALLSLTPGFRWRSLIEGPLVADWRIFLAFVLLTAVICWMLVAWLLPYRLLSLPQNAFRLWVLIMLLYPLVSALPQELVFRALFFGRYGSLFPDRRLAILANAGCFALAHLFFANWLAVTMAFAGGAIFAWVYLEKRSFGFAWLLHAIAGQIIFTSGLGVFFYHGAIAH